MPDNFVRYQVNLYNTRDSPAERNITYYTVPAYEAVTGPAEKFGFMAADCDLLPEDAPKLTGFDGVCKGKEEGYRVRLNLFCMRPVVIFFFVRLAPVLMPRNPSSMRPSPLSTASSTK